MNVLEFKDVSRVYRNGEHEQKALDHVNLKLEEGKFIVVLGPSGAGKSTNGTIRPCSRFIGRISTLF